MTTPDGPASPTNDANEIISRYRDIATAAMTDAEIWLRQGAISRAIPDALPDAVLVVDETGRIVSVNSQFELMFGYHRSVVVGEHMEMLLPEAARVHHIEQRAAYADRPRFRGMGEKLNLLGRRKNGTEFQVLIRLGPIVIPSGTYTIAVIRGIPEQG
jgi:PAS domain S-box-containing protein